MTLLLLLLSSCAPSWWSECYPEQDAYQGVALEGCPVHIERCDDETCHEVMGWAHDYETLWVWEVNSYGTDGEVCILWADCEAL